jgi:hypothetical protein
MFLLVLIKTKGVKIYNKYFVQESSYIDEPCELGQEHKILYFSHIMIVIKESE